MSNTLSLKCFLSMEGGKKMYASLRVCFISSVVLNSVVNFWMHRLFFFCYFDW